MAGNLPLSWDNGTLKLLVSFVKSHCNVKNVRNFLSVQLSQCISKFSKEQTRNLENQLDDNENVANEVQSLADYLYLTDLSTYTAAIIRQETLPQITSKISLNNISFQRTDLVLSAFFF